MKNMPISEKTKSIVGYITDLMITRNQDWFTTKAMNEALAKNLPACEGQKPTVVHAVLAGGAESGLLERAVLTANGKNMNHYRMKATFREDDLLAAYTLYNTARNKRYRSDMNGRVKATTLPLVPELMNEYGPTTLTDIIAMMDDVEDAVIVIKDAIIELKERLA